MKSWLTVSFGVFFLLCVLCQSASARSTTRIKRVSDQRLAELETLMALSKMSGKLVTVPLALGKIDPRYIGRKRRSQSRILDSLFANSLEEEDAGDPVEAANYEDPYANYAASNR